MTVITDSAPAQAGALFFADRKAFEGMSGEYSPLNRHEIEQIFDFTR